MKEPTSYQNYQTLESYHIDKTHVARLSMLTEELADPKDPKGELVPTSEYVAAIYLESKGTDSSTLKLCEHFKSDDDKLANAEAMNYYLTLVDPDEFGDPEEQLKSSQTWLKDKSYRAKTKQLSL